MKVGDYVRTINGIVKIKEIANNVMRDEEDRLHYGDFIKSSPNIIDLIEVGDYVNGEYVTHVSSKNEFLEISREYIYLEPEDIKSIVTKEQFSQMEYKVGEQ